MENENIKLSEKSYLLLQQLFDEKSNLQLPVGVSEQVIEIRKWVKEELERKSKIKPIIGE